MRLFRVARRSSILAGRESGVTLLETLLALAILGAVAVTFLNGLSAISKAAFINDEQATAESLARSQMEWGKNADYVYSTTEYSSAPIPDRRDYINYSAIITTEPLHNPDEGIQKITVTIRRSDKVIIKLEGYKVDR